MNTLISFDESKYKSDKSYFENFIPEIQQAVNAYNLLNLAPLKENELQKLFTNIEELIFDKMTENKRISIDGLEVHKHKALELIKKPEGYDKLLSLVNSLNKRFADTKDELYSIRKIPILQLSTTYELNDSGAIVLKDSKDKELQEFNKKYATSDKAKKLFELANLIIEECKDSTLSELVKWNGEGVAGIITNIIQHKYGVGISLNVDGVMWYNQNK